MHLGFQTGITCPPIGVWYSARYSRSARKLSSIEATIKTSEPRGDKASLID